MIRLLDGPGEGSLMVARAPAYLRVVISPTGIVDALDQLDDVAAPRETIHVYRRVTPATPVHVNMGSRRKGTGFYQMADYRHVPDVDGEALRDRDAWQAWATAQPAP